MSILNGVGLSFDEKMSGFVMAGQADPEKGYEIAKQHNSTIRMDVRIEINDLDEFLNLSERTARLSGSVTFAPIGGERPIESGRFNLFTIDAVSGDRRMTYAFNFEDEDGNLYFFHAYKEIQDDPDALDVVEDMTRAFTRIHRGNDASGEVYGAGIMRFSLVDAPSLVSSIQVIGATSLCQKVAAYSAFGSFAWGVLRDEYLHDARVLFDTCYENLVLSGQVVTSENDHRPFFLVSGVHDKGFPWGDTESFWDLLLLVGAGQDCWRRFAITDRSLPGLMLNVERGRMEYSGPLYELDDGPVIAWSEIRNADNRLSKVKVKLDIEFDCKRFDPVSFPFPTQPKLMRQLSGDIRGKIETLLPATHPLGIHITPNRVFSAKGSIVISESSGPDLKPKVQLTIEPQATGGEAEHSTMRSIKHPQLLYSYLCAVRPNRSECRVQIHTNILRDEKQHWTEDRVDDLLGRVVSYFNSVEILTLGDEQTVRKLDGDVLREQRRASRSLRTVSGEQVEASEELLEVVGAPLIEVRNDQFPTAVFLRSIVKVREPDGQYTLALEEDMSLMRLEPINSERETRVAAIRNPDAVEALNTVLERTDFDTILSQAITDSGKSPDQFCVAIKPNFMFAYNVLDRTTYTDPTLVGELAKRLRKLAVGDVVVVEAQSTMGQYFENRGVRNVASYLGYDGAGGAYRIVDLTEEASGSHNFGPALGHSPVPPTWRDADFRISFAKNKTHSYAYFTLTLKCIYGALPAANKFKEYHCKRDIYRTTMEYLQAFPVHFGLIDASVSADGPFGIFADTRPNYTKTMIGGSDLVAVDWIGATKMGINPLISPYMRLAVERFGKPKIRLVGNDKPYRPWLNVPETMTSLAHKGLDANYQFGNLLYAAVAEMDTQVFPEKSAGLLMSILRKLTIPLRRTLTVRAGEDPTWYNKLIGWLLYKMGY